MKTRYVLGNRSSEIKRLTIQAQFFEPHTIEVLQQCGIKKGMSCLDVGCGSGSVSQLLGGMVGRTGKVVGMDIEQKYVDYCKRTNKLRHVNFIRENISEPRSIKENSFDVVYSRFMFVHLADKTQVLRSMINLAKRDGMIIIQELDHGPDSWLSYPPRRSVETLRKLYFELVKKMGGDPLAGRKLYKLFVDESLFDTKIECSSPCIMMSKKPFSELGWRIAQSLKPQILKNGLMNEKQFKELFDDLKSLAADPAYFVTYARFFSVFGKPKRN